MFWPIARGVRRTLRQMLRRTLRQMRRTLRQVRRTLRRMMRRTLRQMRRILRQVRRTLRQMWHQMRRRTSPQMHFVRHAAQFTEDSSALSLGLGLRSCRIFGWRSYPCCAAMPLSAAQ